MRLMLVGAALVLTVCLFVLGLGVVGAHEHLVSFCLTIITVFAEIPYGHELPQCYSSLLGI